MFLIYFRCRTRDAAPRWFVWLLWVTAALLHRVIVTQQSGEVYPEYKRIKMPPKRAKTERNGSAAPAVNKQWDAALSSADLQEERWGVCVSLVVCDSVYDDVYMKALCHAVQQPLRRLFSLLSHENLLQKVNELGNPKTRKIKELPAFYEVTEVARSVLDSGDELPIDLLAKLVKFQLLDIKNIDIQRRVTAQRVTGAVSPVREKKSSAKGDKGKKAAVEAPPTQKETKLKRRGEESPVGYIDDEPDDGPQHYVLLTGFHQPTLISALESISVQVSNIIRLKSDRRPEHERVCDVSDLQQELSMFWDQLDEVLNRAGPQSHLADVIHLNYCVNQNLQNGDLSEEEEMQEVGVSVFEGVACVVYDSLDWRRQYEHYLNRTRLINIPDTPLIKGSECVDMDLRLYSDLLDSAPPQCVSVALVLHCLIEQVVSSEQEVCDVTAESACKSDLERDLTSYMLQAVNRLPAAQQETSKLMDYFRLKEEDRSQSTKTSPTLLHHHDEISKRLHHIPVLDSLDTVSVEVCMMMKSCRLDTVMKKHLNTNSVNTARRHQLLHNCSSDSLSSADVQRLLQLCVFESMPLTTVNESGTHTLALSHTALPWDDPVTFTHTIYSDNTHEKIPVCDQQQSKFRIEDLKKSLIRNFRHWNFTEHHNTKVFPQVLQTVRDVYRCVDSFASTQSNVVYMICHNPMSHERRSRGSWEVFLHTDVRFRSYLENVADSIRDWSRTEEEKQQQQQRRRQQENETPDTTTKVVSVLEKSEVFIRADSLKAWKLEQDRQKDDDVMKKIKKEKIEKSSAKGERVESTRDSKKSREDECVTHTHTHTHTEQNEEREANQSCDTHIHNDEEPVFIGYRMGGRLVQVSGESQCVYPSDGGQISVDKYHYKHGSTRLKVCVRQNGHCFYTDITEPDRQNTHDQQQQYGCFYAVLRNGLTLAYRQKHQDGDVSPLQLHVSHQHTALQIHFSFQQTTSGQTVLVHQSLPASGSNLPVTHTESSRTITCNGAVIKHMRDGSSMVLFADGTVSVSPDSGPVCVIVRTKVVKNVETSTHTPRKDTKGKSSSGVRAEGAELTSKVELKEQVELTGGLWCTTTPSGERIRTIRGAKVEEKPVQTIYCTDPHTHTVLLTRDDDVLCVLEKHRAVVDHTDGTRMISYQQRETLSQQRSGSHDGGSVNMVQVEKSGYATVMMKCDEKSGEVLFRDGTTISATAHGAYRVCLSDGSCLSLREDGVAVYSSTGPEGDHSGRYIMSHSESLVCEHTDSEGNHYRVTADGGVSITHTHTDTESQTHHNTSPDTQTPRLFMVSPDGSALEFLSSQTVDKILQENTDPSVAVLIDPIPHTQEAFAITILKPFFDPRFYWFSHKHLDDIIPANLKNRKWDTFPASEVKMSGSPIGVTRVNSGVELKERVPMGSDPIPVVLQNPNTLLIRRFTEHTPLTQEHYEHLHNKLLLYINQLLQREKLKDQMKLKEPQTAEEKHLNFGLLQCDQTLDSTPESMFSLYIQAVGVQSTTLPPVSNHSDQQVTLRKPKQKSNWEKRIQQHRSDLQETARQRHALRHRIITPYFHPELQLQTSRAQTLSFSNSREQNFRKSY